MAQRTCLIEQVLFAMSLLACSVRPVHPGDANTTAAAVTTTSTTGPTSSSSTFTGDGAILLVPRDGGAVPECGPWTMNCPEGQKCMPYTSDGDSAWDSWKCVDLVPTPDGLGDPCMVFGEPASGEDTCDDHLMCWFLDWDTGEGTCTAMCGGTPEAPTCPDPTARCVIGDQAFLILCIPSCDPLAQDCAAGGLCIPDPGDPNYFICITDLSGDHGHPFDPCDYDAACDPGHLCASPELATECDPQELGCCLPFCDTTQANTCPGQDQQCLPWSAPGESLPGFEHIGLCTLPP